MSVLLIEDEPAISYSLQHLLHHYFEIEVSPNGRQGIAAALKTTYEVIVLDYNLPDISGLRVCQTLRQHAVTTPILFLTGRRETTDKVQTLNAGADDYLVKPFEAPELLARLRALVRRAPHPGGNPHQLLRAADLTLDPSQGLVTRGTHQVRLRRKALKVLEYLLQHQGRIVSRQELLATAWEDTEFVQANSIDAQIKYLRNNLDRDFPHKLITTVHGLGYKLNNTAPPAQV